MLMSTLNPIMPVPTQPQPVQNWRPSLPCSLMRRWRGLLLGAVMLLMACGPASAQNVNVLGWTNGIFTVTGGVGTVSGWHLNASAQVFVVGVYVDNNALYGSVTFGGAAPSGSMVVQTSGTTRMAVFYWLNPNTSAGQSLVVNYGASNPAYYWAYQLSGLNITAPVVASGTYVANAASTSLTTSDPNSFVLSFYTVNAGGGATALTPNSPLVQVGVTRGDLSTGASIASATNTLATPGTETISWNSTIGANNQGVAALAFTPGQPGAPAVLSAVANPVLTAPGLTFNLTVTVLPGYGNVTNVSVNLTAIGGSAANNLVLSNNNVWTNTFTVPGGAPVGNASLLVTATQDVSPFTGGNYAQITVLAAAPPTIVKDTTPTNLFSMYVGQGVTFSAYFIGPGSITNQWQVSPDVSTYTDIPGATNNTYTLSSANLGDTGAYQLQASDVFGPAVSTYTYITVYDASTALYLWSAPIPFTGKNAEQILTNFPAANKIAGAMVAQNGGNPITVILTNANNQPIVFGGAGSWASLSGGGVYATGANTNKSGNTSFDTCLNNMYSGSSASPNNFHTITLSGLVVGKQYQVQLFALNNSIASPSYVNFADPLDPNQITSQSFGMADNVYELGTFTATNTVMTIQQNDLNSSGSINSIVLRTVGWDPAPYIVQSPANVGAFLGASAKFSGSAADDTTISENPTITYQWASGPVGGTYTNLVEGDKYAGVTTTALTVSNVVAADGDVVYVLQAQNGVSTTTSREARLYVQSPPILPTTNSFAGAVLTLTNNNLIGLWILNETNDPSTGLLTAYDASGNGHSGTYANNTRNAFNGVLGPQPPTVAGFAANQGAVQTGVGGTSDVNSIVNLPPLNTTNGVATTICMWINPSQNVGFACGLFFSRYSNSGEQVGFGYCNGNNTLGYLWNNANGESTFNYNSGLTPPNNQWSFVALVVRTNASTFYLNYVDANGAAHTSQASDTAATYTQVNWSGNSIWLGGDQYPGGTGAGAGRIFPGRISDVAVFNSALTDQQINQLFTAGYQVVGFPPAFAQQPPTNTATYTGYTLQIVAQVGGSLPLTNQWSFNGTNLVDGWNNGSIIIGSTSNVLTILNVSSNWQGVYNLAVTNSLGGVVSSNAMATVLPPVPPPAGNLVGRWFAGATNLTDVSGFLPGIHDGTQIKTNGVAVGILKWSSDLPPNIPAGNFSLALTNAGVQINNTSTNDANYEATFDAGISNAMTITLWAKGWPAAWNPFVSKYGETTPSPAGGWQVRNDGNNNTSPCWTIRGNPGTTVLGTAVFGNPEDTAATSLTYGNDGKWHFYCATYDVNAGQRILYVDGSLVAYTTGQGQYTTVPLNYLAVGARDQGGTNGFTGFFTGRIYDVRVYNAAISGAQQAYLVPPPPLPALKVSASVTAPSGGNPGHMVLSWLNGGWLLQSTNVAGPWLTNQAATPPYTILTTNTPAEFYKVLFPQNSNP
jgi:hypothetical protein